MTYKAKYSINDVIKAHGQMKPLRIVSIEINIEQYLDRYSGYNDVEEFTNVTYEAIPLGTGKKECGNIKYLEEDEIVCLLDHYDKWLEAEVNRYLEERSDVKILFDMFGDKEHEDRLKEIDYHLSKLVEGGSAE